MALKPLFYMLAKHGPWSHHVRVQGVETMLEVEKWLYSTGKKLNVDWESLVENIEHRHTKKNMVWPAMGQTMGKTTAQMTKVVQTVEPIIFVNDVSIATYIKMKWGGR